MIPPHVAVVMPAYNEEGLADFIAEIEQHLVGHVASLSFVVVDDTSTVPVSTTLDGLTPRTTPVHVLRNAENLGHGPSALRAYRAGLSTGADVVVHVDGDGQVGGADVVRLIHAVAARGVDGVVGNRVKRTDPWFRIGFTLVARALVTAGRGRACDANSPMRAYRSAALQRLLDEVSPAARVPHLQFSVLERRRSLAIVDIDIAHRVRRGDSATGTMWGPRRRLSGLPSRRLIGFSVRSAGELVAVNLRRSQASQSQSLPLILFPELELPSTTGSALVSERVGA